MFGNPESYQGSVLLIIAVLSAVQIYCHFSGYMDIALGVSEIFGIQLEDYMGNLLGQYHYEFFCIRGRNKETDKTFTY